MMLATILAAALLAGQTSPAAAPPQSQPQTQGQTDTATAVQDVVVNASRESAYEAARQFVDAAVEPPPHRGLARWDRKVCVGIANMRAAVAQPLIDRVSARIVESGLDIGDPGCRPNVLVVATNDGAAMAHGLVEARYRAFNPGVDGSRLTLAALDRFQSNDDPVRWWRITLPVDADTGEPTVRLPGDPPPVNRVRQPSRIRSQSRNIFTRVFIILDVAKANGVDVNALGDYLAMVSLSQIDADADFSNYSTILTLFDEPNGPRELTAWDQSYIRALYNAELNETRSSSQMGSVAGAMARDRQGGQDAPEGE